MFRARLLRGKGLTPTGVLAALGSSLAIAQESSDVDDLWNFDEFEEVDPTFLELAGQQAPDILIFAAFVTLAMVSFLRKSVPLKYVTLIFAVGYLGITRAICSRSRTFSAR